MDELYLKRIEMPDKDNFLDFFKELVSCGSSLDGACWYSGEESFEKVMEQFKKHDIPFTGYEQKVPVMYQYCLYRKSDEKLVGLFGIRPYLTRRLDETNGGSCRI